MRIRAAAILCAAVAAASALTGCGNSTSAVSATAHATKVAFKSTALKSHLIPAKYTCDGTNVNPPLEWGAVPRGTGTLLLAVFGLKPTSPQSSNVEASVEWAIAGINPALHKLKAGQQPPGSHVGVSRNGTRRYNICPKKGTIGQYQFMLYGVPANVAVSPNFADEPVLATLTKPGTPATITASGAFVAIYKRR